MKKLLFFSPILLVALWANAQTANSTDPAQNPTATGTGQAQRQSNAASATKDTSGTSGDQVTPPAGTKGSTVIGCLAGPYPDGHYMLNSMQYRSGVQVLGPGGLNGYAGQKVKLTGEWTKGSTTTDATGKQARRFQASSFEVLTEKCPPPQEVTPIGKKKQKEKAAAAADAANPK